jgi:hypothetical protein
VVAKQVRSWHGVGWGVGSYDGAGVGSDVRVVADAVGEYVPQQPGCIHCVHCNLSRIMEHGTFAFIHSPHVLSSPFVVAHAPTHT